MLVIELKNGSRIIDCKITGHSSFNENYVYFKNNIDRDYIEKLLKDKDSVLYFETNGVKGEINVGKIKHYEVMDYFKFISPKEMR